MFSKIPQKLRKIIKPLAKKAAIPVLWFLILVNHYLFRFRKNSIPAILISLCLGDTLVFKIDPELIRSHIKDPDIVPDNLFVWSGDWDKKIIDIWQHEKFKLIKELTVEKKDYKDTSFFSQAMARIKSGNPVFRGDWLLDSREKVLDYFKRQEKLFKKVKADGFDLRQAPETGIAITRKGDIVHYRQGHHTLAMAKVLGVDKVNVRVRAVHSLWLLKIIGRDRLKYLKSIQKAIGELKVRK